MIKPSKLSVTIHDVEFAKDFQYFISVHYEGIKVCALALFRNKLMSLLWPGILYLLIILFSLIRLRVIC